MEDNLLVTLSHGFLGVSFSFAYCAKQDAHSSLNVDIRLSSSCNQELLLPFLSSFLLPPFNSFSKISVLKPLYLFCIRQSRSTFSSQLRAFTLYLKYFSQVDLKSCFLFCSHCLRLQRLMPSLSAYSLWVRPSFIRIALICLPWPFLRKRL